MPRSLLSGFLYALSALVLISIVIPTHSLAQFDLGKVKKSAEKTLDKIIKDSDDEEKEQQTREPSPEAKQQMGINDDSESEAEAEKMLDDVYWKVRELLSINSFYSGMLSNKKEAQNFYDKCKEADYPNARKTVERAMEMKPAMRESQSHKYDDIMTRFPPHFDGLVKGDITKEINAAIELAYAEKAKGSSRAGAALEAAEAALLTAEAVLLVTPDDVNIQQLRDDAKVAAESMGASLASAVYTGEFHRQHAGEIVFSSSPITPGAESVSAMKDNFAAGDNIYGMMYFKGIYNEVTNNSNVAYTAMLVDGNEMVRYNFKLDGAAREASTLKSEVVPDPAQSTTRGALLFTEKLKNISPRRHTITIRTLDDYGKTIAEGSFKLDCSKGLDRIAEVHRQLGEKKLSGVSLPSPAMRNASLEKEMMASLGAWKETPLKVIITDRDWTIQHHPVTGAIVSRTINTTTVFKKADGTCRMFEVSYKQDYNGRGYGKAKQYGVGDSADILCSKVK
ncbi:hypothetical protein KQI65_06950 [bacterium]|nr:hypothetical protein [bacterium]